MLMGGSVVGIAYQIEKSLSPNRSPILWKTLFIPAGFVAVYSVISLAVSPSDPSWWALFIIVTTALVIMALRFTEKPHSGTTKNDRAVNKLEEKMKNCC